LGGVGKLYEALKTSKGYCRGVVESYSYYGHIPFLFGLLSSVGN
jgi:hypothetical protein